MTKASASLERFNIKITFFLQIVTKKMRIFANEKFNHLI